MMNSSVTRLLKVDSSGSLINAGVNPKIGVGKTPKMDGENNGTPYEQMDDLGVFPQFLETSMFG